MYIIFVPLMVFQAMVFVYFSKFFPSEIDIFYIA